MINVFENRKTRRSGTKNEEQWCNLLYLIRVICSLLFSLLFLSSSPFCKKKKEKFGNFGWKLDKEDKRGVCYREVVACVSGVEVRKKGVGMGREGKRLPLLFSYRKIALTLPSPFLGLPLTQAKELDMSCDTIGTTFS